MKRVRREEEKAVFYCDRFGRRFEENLNVLISYLEPESETEREQFTKLYQKLRKKYLQQLQNLSSKINILERCVDEFNKRQILLMDEKLDQALSKTRWYLRFFMPTIVPSEILDELLIPKTEICFLRDRAFDLLDSIYETEITFPMKERSYTILIDFDFFMQHLLDTYREINTAVAKLKGSKRHQLLNVSF